ncbi:MAG: hypothetical protein RJA22_1303 [Verrucomicrobiota bacterium]|jgi:hypothetical protein
MHWLKRNLFLAITGLAGVLLLGGGIALIVVARGRNAELDEGVNETRAQLDGFYARDPFPHKTNIDSARRQSTQLRSEAQKLAKFFAPVPVDRVDAKQFLAMRDRTLSDLREEAQKAGVVLPVSTPPFAFSFGAQRAKIEGFGAGTFPTVPEQMAEVKAICTALYEARVTQIVQIRRARASADDEATTAPTQDYTAGVGITTNASVPAVTHPFEVTFTCFSAEVAQVLASLARSPYGFLVKAVQIEPESAQGHDGGPSPVAAGAQAGASVQPGAGRRPGVKLVEPRPAAPVATSTRPTVLLKERRLKVTLLVYAIRPAK